MVLQRSLLELSVALRTFPASQRSSLPEISLQNVPPAEYPARCQTERRIGREGGRERERRNNQRGLDEQLLKAEK